MDTVREAPKTIGPESYDMKVKWLIATIRGLENARLWDDLTTRKAMGCVLIMDGVARGKIKIEAPLPIQTDK